MVSRPDAEYEGSYADPGTAVDATTLSTLSFYEQYAAAAYCVSNNQAGSSTKVTCNGNCPQVQSNDANTVLEFQK